MKQTKNITPTNMICICCPLGCSLTIIKSDNEWLVTGNKCLRGKKYAAEEMTAPKRVVTSTVKIAGGLYPMIPVKTEQPIPKEKIFTIMNILASVRAVAPITMGDIVIKNVADTGVNVVATKTDKGMPFWFCHPRA